MLHTSLARWAAHFICAVFLLGTGSSVYAACASPTGVAGQLQWVAAYTQVRYCNGTTWVAMNSASSGVACSIAGQVSYRSGEIMYCNGSLWLKSAPTTNYGACAAALAGNFYYATAGNYYWFCNGSNWRRMGP